MKISERIDGDKWVIGYGDGKIVTVDANNTIGFMDDPNANAIPIKEMYEENYEPTEQQITYGKSLDGKAQELLLKDQPTKKSKGDK